MIKKIRIALTSMLTWEPKIPQPTLLSVIEEELLLSYQFTATPSPPSCVYIQSAVLTPIKIFPWPHSIKKCSPKLEVQDDPRGFIF